MISASAITAVTTVSSATANCHLHSNGKRNGEQRRTKVSFDRNMMGALELLWLVSDSQSVSQSDSQSIRQ